MTTSKEVFGLVCRILAVFVFLAGAIVPHDQAGDSTEQQIRTRLQKLWLLGVAIWISLISLWWTP